MLLIQREQTENYVIILQNSAFQMALDSKVLCTRVLDLLQVWEAGGQQSRTEGG